MKYIGVAFKMNRVEWNKARIKVADSVYTYDGVRSNLVKRISFLGFLTIVSFLGVEEFNQLNSGNNFVDEPDFSVLCDEGYNSFGTEQAAIFDYSAGLTAQASDYLRILGKM